MKRLRELAFLNKGLRISLYDEREADKKDSFYYEGGISEYVAMINANKNPIHETIVDVSGKDKDISVEIALQYNETYNSSLDLFFQA